MAGHDDTGKLDIALGDVWTEMWPHQTEPPQGPCDLTLTIDRFVFGAVERAFPARSATGIFRRNILLTLDR